MDLESLKTFISLASTKNYTRCSRQMFVAQSTVTNRIMELEKELNVPLFIRNNRSVELTVEGEYFLTYARKMIELTDTSLSEITSTGKYKSHLRIGSADSIYESYLAPIILNMTKNNPDDSIKITIGISSNLIEQLESNILDIAFSYLPLNKSDYKCEIYRQDPLVLVTDYKNKHFANGISREELQNVNYLMCNFALWDVGQFIRSLFPKYHRFSLEIDDCSKIIPFLLHMDKYTFIPKDMAGQYIEKKILREIPLINLKTPAINSYIIGKKSKIELWNELINQNQLNN